MTRSIDRRTAIAMTSTAAMSLVVPAGAAQRQESATSQPPMSSILPNTDYFELDSKHAGARYAIWVAKPRGYDRDPSRQFPAIYLTDGNSAAPRTIPGLEELSSDPINPIVPFVEICVGYPPEDAARALAVRARDLLPPSEFVPEGIEAGMQVLVRQGLLDQAGADLYLHNLRNPAGDKFLAFLTEELSPLIADRYRVDPDSAGLFGYSYGGLFSVYAALRRTPLFRRIGAGSPGILPQHSKVFKMYAAEQAAKADYSGRMLHMTVNEREITYPTYYQSMVAAGAMQLIALAGQTPLDGLAFSSRIVPKESHASGYSAAWFDFLRTCYSARSGAQAPTGD